METEPLVLCNLRSADTEFTNSKRSRRTFACRLLAVTLPKSKQVVWLPLRYTRHTDVTELWEQRFGDLDDQLAATRLEASASATPTQAPTPPAAEAFISAKRQKKWHAK